MTKEPRVQFFSGELIPQWGKSQVDPSVYEWCWRGQFRSERKLPGYASQNRGQRDPALDLCLSTLAASWETLPQKLSIPQHAGNRPAGRETSYLKGHVSSEAPWPSSAWRSPGWSMLYDAKEHVRTGRGEVEKDSWTDPATGLILKYQRDKCNENKLIWAISEEPWGKTAKSNFRK